MSAQTNSQAKQIFDRAVSLMKSRAFTKAETVLQDALHRYPNDPNLLRLLGVSLFQQEKFTEAEKRLVHSVRLVPEFAVAHENLAEVFLAQGKFDAAIRSLRAAIKHNPSPGAARQKLAEVLALIGRGAQADEVFEEALRSNPDRKLLVKAMQLAQEGNVTGAERIYRDVLRDDPENIDALRLLGVLCVRQDNYSDAEAFFKRAVQLKPDYWKAWMNLGTAQNEQQKFSDAESSYRRALAIKPGAVQTLEKLGTNCMNDGRIEDAINWLDRALVIDSAHFPSLLCLGHALKTIGRQQEAIDAYRRCAAAKPDFGEVYWSLANLKTFRFEEQEVQEMKRQLDSLPHTEQGEDSEISFAFALGKALEDRQDYGAAFESYSRGNDKKRFKVNYDPVDFERTNDRIIEVFDSEFFEQRQGHGCSDGSPILIVGLPRSGSTLLEQILASHSLVEGTAELHYLMRVATETGLNRIDGIRYPEYVLELKPHQLDGLGQQYVEYTEQHRTGAPYFTDKMPNNFVAIGFLQAILPNAKVIDARRHPLDSCLGTFKQLFARGQVFSYDLFDLAHYYTQYMRMMDHWTEVLPGKVLTVHYEEVVDDLEGQARRIAEHCGLDWEDQMLRYHETERAVKTASSEQVRQPIYRGSVNLWRNYEEHLAELVDYLEPVLSRLPKDQQPKSLRAANP
ncbi:MAG: sulfotransferase [Pseudomonadota bacterium]